MGIPKLSLSVGWLDLVKPLKLKTRQCISQAIISSTVMTSYDLNIKAHTEKCNVTKVSHNFTTVTSFFKQSFNCCGVIRSKVYNSLSQLGRPSDQTYHECIKFEKSLEDFIPGTA